MAAVELNTSTNDVISTSNVREVKVKYRWYRTIETKSNIIQLMLPFSQIPVELSYIGTGNGVDAYESADVVVPCGTHNGCRLLIDDVVYQLEPFDVKHYSFEIHVYIEDDDQIDIDQLNDVTGHVTAIDSSYVESAVSQQQQQQQQYQPKSSGDDINVMDDVIVEDDVPPAPSQPSPQKLKTPSVASGVCTPNTATSRSRCSSGSTSRRLSRLESLLRQQIADKDTVAAPAVTTSAETGSSNDGQSAPPPPMRAALLPNRSSLASGPRYDWLGTGLDEARTAMSTRVPSGSVDRLATSAGNAQGQQWQPPPADASNALMSRSRSVESVVSAAGTTYSLSGLPPPAVKQPTDLDSIGTKRQHQQQMQQQLNGSISQSLSGLNDIDDNDDNDDDDASDDTATLMTPMTTQLRPEVGYYVDQQTNAKKQPITSATNSFSPISSSTRQNSISAPVLAGIGTTDRNYQTGGDSTLRGVGSSSVTSVDKVSPVITISSIPHQASGSEVLLRKINELENHLADVQEANRTTLAKLKASEQTIAELQQENDLLRQATGNRRIQQLEEENQSLRTQLQIMQQTTAMSTAGDGYTSRDGGAWSSLHAEVRQLRDELNNLRDDNRRLVQSNQMLMMQRFGADVKPMNGVYDNGGGRNEDIKQSQPALDKRNEPSINNWLNDNSLVTGGLDHSSHQQSSGRGVWYDSLDKFAARQPTSGIHNAGGHVTANNVSDGSWAPANQTKRSENVTTTSSTFDIYLPNYNRDEQPFNQRTGRSQSTDRMTGRLGDRNVSTGYHKSSQAAAADCSVLSSSSAVVRDQSSRPASSSGLRYTDGGGGPRPAVKRSDVALFPSSDSDRFDADAAQRMQLQQQRQQQQQQQQQLDGLPPRPVRQTNQTQNAAAAAADHRSASVAVGVDERSLNRQVPNSNSSQTTGAASIAARLTSVNPASKRLSISSTSTESILQEADWMLDVVRQTKPSGAVNAATTATTVPSSTAVAAQAPASRATLEQTSSRLQQQVIEDRRLPDANRNFDRIPRDDRIEPYVNVTTSLQTSARTSRHSFIETSAVSGIQQQQQQQQQLLTRSADFTNSRENSFVTNTKRPFAPRSPTDVSIGDDVKFLRQGGKISKGRVKYIGHLPDKKDIYLGIELEQELGKHDGVFNGQRIFQCQPNRGVFVAFSKVIMAWCD